ncbi:MAG: metal ABC transporter permease [Patescibacteria group bacterium]|nr:metal ABC transporter permease [Patescibacteria group bacterium]MDD5490412.1 metal ABC transporter permease [Patescibacteria group bacterium]
MFEFLAYSFIQRALIAGVIIGIITAVLGVFVILRKMSFFSDAIAHSSLTGIALGALLNFDPLLGAVVFCILVALGIAFLNKKSVLSIDAIIGVFFSASVALGVVVIGFLRGYRVDLFKFLFGDILGVTSWDIIIISVLGIAVLALVAFLFKDFAKIAFHRDLAEVEGLAVDFYDYLFMFILALTVAVGLKIAGAILIGPLLIIPPATAKNMAINLKEMLVFSVIVGVLSALIGIVASYYLNTASGPTIVLASSVIFIFSLFYRRFVLGSSL